MGDTDSHHSALALRDAFRIDAKAHGKIVRLGGWQPTKDEQGRLSPWLLCDGGSSRGVGSRVSLLVLHTFTRDPLWLSPNPRAGGLLLSTSVFTPVPHSWLWL